MEVVELWRWLSNEGVYMAVTRCCLKASTINFCMMPQGTKWIKYKSRLPVIDV